MAEKKFTVLELHLHDVDFSPTNTAPFLSRGGADEESDETTIDVKSADEETEPDATDEEASDDDSPGRLVRLLALVLLFAIAAAAAKKFRGDDEFEELAEFDEESEAEA